MSHVSERSIHRLIWAGGMWLLLGSVVVFLDLWILGSLSALALDMTGATAPDLTAWRETWLHQPDWVMRQMLEPTTQPTREVALLWRNTQPLVILLTAWAGWNLWSGGRSQSGPAGASHYGSHGIARWGTAGERVRLLRVRDPGIRIGKAGRRRWRLLVPSDGSLNDFVILFGPSKSGKSSRYVIPNVLGETEASMVITDPKGEVYRHTAAALEARGYQVWVLNLKDLPRSMRFNPLNYCETPQDVLQLVSTVLRNTSASTGGDADIWGPAERAYISALMLYVLYERPVEERHMASVLRLATTIARDCKAMDAIYDRLGPDHPALQAYNIFRLAADADKMRAGIITGAAVRLQLWAIPDLAALTAGNDFDIRDLGRKKVALYLILRDDTAAFAPVTSLFFTLVIEQLYREADNAGGRLPVHVRLRLDECANIGAFPEFSAKIATMRSRGISPEIILQDLGQLKRLYPDTWSTIMGNCDVQIVFGANDLATAEYISKRLGTQTIRTASQGQSNTARGMSVSESLQYTGRPLLMVDEVLNMRRDDLVLCLAGHHPFRLQKAPYTDYPEGRNLEMREPSEFQPPLRGRVVITDPSKLLPTDQALQPGKPSIPDPLQFLDEKSAD